MRDLIELSNEYKDEKAFKKEIAKDLKKTIASMQEETLAEAIESISRCQKTTLRYYIKF